MPKLTDIIGHRVQRDLLANDIKHKNVAHAYLFSGEPHLGKMPLALQFACDLLSADVPEAAKPGVHTAVEKLTHPDLLVLDRLWVEKTCEDWDFIAKRSNVPQAHRAKHPAAKTNTIGIDDIRTLQQLLLETGTGTYRCCILRSVERMQSEAANAFLNTLEEPPEGLVLLLTTASQGELLPTIISRTRIVPFQRVATKEMLQLLEGVPEDDRRFILHIAAGAPGMVIRLRDDPDFLRLHRTVHGVAQSFWRTVSLRERLQFLQPLSKRGKESDDLLLHLCLTLRELPPVELQRHTAALSALIAHLQTNAHRQLCVGQFAMEVSM